MKTIALTWELGGGFGHLTTLLPIARALLERGDRVYLIARNLWTAGPLFQDSGVRLLQAPFRHGKGLQYNRTPTFAYILYNIGFCDAAGLAGLVAGWESLFEMIEPDLVVADHSPTALLAARGMDLPAIVWGTGFYCPPNVAPLPAFQPEHDAGRNRNVERDVLDCMNDCLRKWRAAPLEHVAALYHDGPRRFLLTFEELDHYPQRRGDRHRGYWPFHPGAAPDWPKATGPKVFVYLKHFPQIAEVLEDFSRAGNPMLVYIDGVDPKLRRRLESPTLRFADEMVDLEAVAREAAVGITNANIGTITGLLLRGVPQLCLPLTLEQGIVAGAVERMGAGRILTPRPGSTPAQALRELIDDSQARACAQSFADKYRDFREDRQLAAFLAECDGVI